MLRFTSLRRDFPTMLPKDLLASTGNSIELDKELAPYVRSCPVLGAVLQHPLVYEVPFHPVLAAWTNARLEHKRTALKDAIDAHEWRSAVFLHERPWRAHAIAEFADAMTDTDYWRLVAHAYTDSENIGENYALWESLLSADRPGREAMMDRREFAIYSGLPDELTLFRGDVAETPSDFSWTLDADVAHWFARRTARLQQSSTPRVITGRASRADVIAYKDNRGEKEILLHPKHVIITNSASL